MSLVINFFITPLISCKVIPSSTLHLTGTTFFPVISKSNICPTFLWTELFLTNVVSPTTTSHTNTTTQHQHINNVSIVHIGIEPVVDSTTHDYHTPPFIFGRVLGKFTSNLNNLLCFYSRTAFLPSRSKVTLSIHCIFSSKFIITSPINSHLSHHQIINISYQVFFAICEFELFNW